jgi:hypothetical protein
MKHKQQILFLVVVVMSIDASAVEPVPTKWIDATAYVIPKETATDGEGYFAIIEGHNRRLYIGTHANAVNSWLVEFDPGAEKMKIVVDAHKAIGNDLKGFGAQAKIHTRNNTGKLTGKIYFGTKQGYPTQGRARPRSIRFPFRTMASTASRPTNHEASPTYRPVPITAPAPARTLSFWFLI